MKKNIALLLASLLILTMFAGCKPSESPAVSPSTPGTSTTVSPSGAATTTTPSPSTDVKKGMDAWTKFTNQVHITVPVYDRAKVGYPDVANNYWTKWIQKEFGDTWNVKVEYVGIPRGDVMTKYSMLIAAKQTPTIMMEYDYPKVAQWADEGAMGTIDLAKFDAVAPTFYQAMVDNNQLGYTDINGKTYFVLTERPYYNTTFTFATFCRLDWLKQIGMTDVPKNYADFSKAMDAFIAQGISEHPLGLSVPTAAYVGNFAFRKFPVDEAEWAMHSSLGTASLSWYPTERMLKRYNTEFNKGWYSTEFELETPNVAGSSGQMLTDFVNGKLFQYGGYIAANMAWLTSFYQNNPTAELKVVSNYAGVEAGVMDQPAIRADNPFGMIVGFSSRATEDQLKAAWMLMEWMIQEENLFTLENGVLGKTYNMDATTGLPVIVADYTGEEMLNHNMNIDMACLVHASKKVGTAEDTIKAMSPQGLPQDFTQQLIDNYKELVDIASKGWAYSDPVFSVAIPEESEYTATLLSKYKEDFVKLVKAPAGTFDSLYQTLSSEYLSAGYQKIIDARKAAYNNGSTTKLPEISK